MSADYNEEAYENASVNFVNTDLEAGFEFKFIIDPKTKDEKEKKIPFDKIWRQIFHSVPAW